MASKSKKSKKQTKPEPASQPGPETAPRREPEAVADAAILAQLAALTADVTACGPWPNRRIAVVCPVCNESHASPVAYITRLVRRGSASADEIRWLRQHLTASGIQVPAA